MAEFALVVPVVMAAQRVITGLKDLQSKKKHNQTIAKEIEEFISSLDENIVLMKEELPRKDGSWAIESLTKDLDEAADYLDEGLKNGNFEKYWEAKDIKDKLERLRQDLINKFQVKLFITTLEVAIEADEKIEDFGSRMLELSSLSAARSEAVTSEIRNLLQPLVVGMRRQDQRIQSFVSMVRGNEVRVETSTDTQKFLADVMSNLEDLTDETPSMTPFSRQESDGRDNYLDPNTKELMIDPVKCKDGRTYDRFAVFHYNLTQRVPLVIACDDIDVRGRLFEKFAKEGVENKFRLMRKAYRDQGLELADKGHLGEALSYIKNVLEWAPDDEKCIDLKEKLEYQISKHNKVETNVPEVLHKPSAPKIEQMPSISAHNTHQPQQPYNRQPHNQRPKQNVEDLAVGIIVMVLCFPCSLCCIPCLFPDACGGSEN